jgi:hypothetical protein
MADTIAAINAELKRNPPAFPGDIGMHAGMTLRDYFAGQALAGFLAGHAPVPPECKTGDQARAHTAEVAYKAADAMLTARSVQP